MPIGDYRLVRKVSLSKVSAVIFRLSSDKQGPIKKSENELLRVPEKSNIINPVLWYEARWSG